MKLIGWGLVTLLAASAAWAQGATTHDRAGHSAMHEMHAAASPTEAGQGAFAAIAEVVLLLQADPETDWSKVDIGALREHLVDMNELTLNAIAREDRFPAGCRSRSPAKVGRCGRSATWCPRTPPNWPRSRAGRSRRPRGRRRAAHRDEHRSAAGGADPWPGLLRPHGYGSASPDAPLGHGNRSADAGALFTGAPSAEGGAFPSQVRLSSINEYWSPTPPEETFLGTVVFAEAGLIRRLFCAFCPRGALATDVMGWERGADAREGG